MRVYVILCASNRMLFVPLAAFLGLSCNCNWSSGWLIHFHVVRKKKIGQHPTFGVFAASIRMFRFYFGNNYFSSRWMVNHLKEVQQKNSNGTHAKRQGIMFKRIHHKVRAQKKWYQANTRIKPGEQKKKHDEKFCTHTGSTENGLNTIFFLFFFLIFRLFVLHFGLIVCCWSPFHSAISSSSPERKGEEWKRKLKWNCTTAGRFNCCSSCIIGRSRVHQQPTALTQKRNQVRIELNAMT